MPMLAAVTCAARRRRMHCRGYDTASAAAVELDRGQHGPGDYCDHRWRDEPAPVGMPGGREQTRRQGRQRLLRDGGPALGSRRRQRQAVAAGAEQAPVPEARSQPGPGSSATVVVSKKKAPAAGEACAGVETASASASAAAALSSEEASSSAVLCAVCLEEVPTVAEVTTLPCSHSYHAGCVLPWLAERGACPCCRIIYF